MLASCPTAFGALLLLGTPACAAGPAASGPLDAPPPVALPSSAPRAFDHSHRLWDGILRRHVHGDAFDYAALAKDRGDLDAYLRTLHAVTPEQLASWSREQRFAFWINTYNAHTVQKVVDHYPIRSIKKLSGAFGLNSVFDDRFIDMPALHPAGKKKKLSLNDIEHEILRKRFKDARVHAAINCASRSCPPLRNEAFVADRLDRQLDEQMRAFLADSSRNRYDHAKGILWLSKVFDWFEEDFVRDRGSVRDYVLAYCPEDERDFVRNAKIRYLDYDWSLNDVPAED